MEDQTGEIRTMTVRLLVDDHDRGEHIAETVVSSVDEIEPEMIKSLSQHLVKRITAEVVVRRSKPVRKDQLPMPGVEA